MIKRYSGLCLSLCLLHTDSPLFPSSFVCALYLSTQPLSQLLSPISPHLPRSLPSVCAAFASPLIPQSF